MRSIRENLTDTASEVLLCMEPKAKFIALRIVRLQGLVFKKGQIKPRTKSLPLFTELGPTDRAVLNEWTIRGSVCVRTWN
jgi:hypothetical protein